MASRFKNILTGWINSLRDQFGLLPEAHKELFDSRLEICRTNECGMLKLGICTACGCPVKKKTKVMTENCPENMWNPTVYNYNGTLFIRVSEIPEKLQSRLMVWMRGQQRPVIPELDPQDAVYNWDWESFLEYSEGKQWD